MSPCLFYVCTHSDERDNSLRNKNLVIPATTAKAMFLFHKKHLCCQIHNIKCYENNESKVALFQTWKKKEKMLYSPAFTNLNMNSRSHFWCFGLNMLTPTLFVWVFDTSFVLEDQHWGRWTGLNKSIHFLILTLAASLFTFLCFTAIPSFISH